jgi:phosphoglycerate dehydrogenase-like enzyme
MLKVHYYKEQDSVYQQNVNAVLGNTFRFTVGKELPTDIDILILAYPTATQLESCSNLKYLLIPFVGIPRQTRELMLKYPQITVINIHHNARVVAEMVVGFIFALSKHILIADQSFRQHDWSFRYGTNPSFLLWHKKVLICGYGTIGRYIDSFLMPYEMQIDKIKRSGIDMEKGIYPLSELNTIIGDYDIIINLLPDTPETLNVFNSLVFSNMKPTAIFINTGRASTVEEEAFYNSLKSGSIAGAAVDVWYNYPRTAEDRRNCNPANFPFHELKNIILSPHRAGGLGMPENEQFRTEEIIKILINLQAGNNIPSTVNLAEGY